MQSLPLQRRDVLRAAAVAAISPAAFAQGSGLAQPAR